MTQRSSSKDNYRDASSQAGREPDAVGRLYEAMNSPLQRRALDALSKVTVDDLRQHYQPGSTEVVSRD